MPEAPNPKLYAGAAVDPPTHVAACDDAYAELDVVTNFSFLRGASHPDELVYAAALLGYRAMAVTDVNSLAGVVRAFTAARKVKGFRLIVGARLTFTDGSPDLLAWPADRAAYARLCRLLTLGRRRAPKGECHLRMDDFLAHSDGMQAAIAPPAWPCEDERDVVGTLRSRSGTTAGPLRSDTGFQPVPARSAVEGVWNPTGSTPDAARTGWKPVSLSSDWPGAHLLKDALGDRLSLAVNLCHGGDDRGRLAAAVAAGRRLGVPLVATNHVHYHDPARRPLHDVLTCVRHGCTVREAGFRLFPNAERYLKPPRTMRRLFADHPAAIERGLEISRRCDFKFEDITYDYPDDVTPPGRDPSQHLRDLTYAGAADRYPNGIPPGVRDAIEKELAFICHSKYEAYFLTVYDLVRFARSRDILCQGRGSAANSAVCYCLGVTAVDPDRFTLVFERFASGERAEPPDIDVDFEHERREEVIQYVYAKYGRDRAAMTGSLITYRGRSAVRDVGKVLGFGQDTLDVLAGKLDWWHAGSLSDAQVREAGVDPADPGVQHLLSLTTELLGFPRHLGQHVGGMVVSRRPLHDVVPIENAAMADRTVIEWDKDDLDAVQIFKVDILALGMLTAIAKALAMVNGYAGATVAFCPCTSSTVRRSHGGTEAQRPGLPPDDPLQSDAAQSELVATPGRPDAQPECTPKRTANQSEPSLGEGASNDGRASVPLCLCGSSGIAKLQMHTVPQEDPRVYAMISDADTVGVFQIESRAQMSMLPRLRPATFYDLVIEVAIVRPGPIQGDMVHPYLKQRELKRRAEAKGLPYKTPYPKDELIGVLEKTLGVPLFQEQVMRLAMVAAGFTGAEADGLRRAMAAWKRGGEIEKFHDKFVRGMTSRGYQLDFAERCFKQVCGFGEYGFPESHAASFAKLVYVSAWIKRYHPAAFLAALLNSQPMGFYAPAQLVRDAREHGVEVRPVDVNASDWDCTLERDGRPPFVLPTSPDKATWGVAGPAVRLGFRRIKGMREDDGRRIAEARRRHGPFASVAHLQSAAGLDPSALHRLAGADALTSIQPGRRQGMWQAMALSNEPSPLFDEVHDGTLGGPPTAPPPPAPLPPMRLGEEVIADYATTGLSLKRHPVSFARAALAKARVTTAASLADAARFPHGRAVAVAGLVLVRQRPGTASGVVFVTLEDETGVANLIIWSNVYERYRRQVRHATLLSVHGTVQREGQVVHVLARRFVDRTPLLAGLTQPSRDFH